MALENDDLIVVQKSGGGELRKAKISDIKPDAPDLQLTAELVFSAESNADVEWDTTVRALATGYWRCSACCPHVPVVE